MFADLKNLIKFKNFKIFFSILKNRNWIFSVKKKERVEIEFYKKMLLIPLLLLASKFKPKNWNLEIVLLTIKSLGKLAKKC